MFLEFGRDVLQQVGVHVNRHKIERDVVLLDLRRSEEKLFLPLFTVGSIKVVMSRHIRLNSQFFRIRFENVFEIFKYEGKISLSGRKVSISKIKPDELRENLRLSPFISGY